MITEDYVSFEIAKLLKEKGFPQEYDVYHSMVYNEEDYEDEYEAQRMVIKTRFVKAGTLSSYPIGVPDPKCYCPSIQIAMKWLREQNKIISILHSYVTNKYKIIITQFNKLDIANLGNTLYSSNDYDYFSYEEACETAIRYCLENLI